MQAPKPPSETSERRLSRDKGPAPPPPPMRQDSEEKKKKDEERENIPKTVEKVVNLADKQKSEDKPHVNKLSQSEKMADQQPINIKEQKNLETEDQTQNEVDSSEKIKKVESEGNGKLFDNIKRFESQQKLINNKSSSSKKQLGINEKRKSAPVKPEMIEDLSKIIYKQSSFEDKNR